jgi:hypothetical protein
MHEARVQIRSLALHYFTVQYPTTEAHRHDTAAQLLARQVCPPGGDAHLEGGRYDERRKQTAREAVERSGHEPWR